MIGIDDKTTCSVCGAQVRKLGLEAHQRKALCYVTAACRKRAEEGFVPVAIDNDSTMMRFLRRYGIPVFYEAISASKYGVVYGAVVPQWLACLFDAGAGQWKQLILYVFERPELQAELTATWRLGGIDVTVSFLNDLARSLKTGPWKPK